MKTYFTTLILGTAFTLGVLAPAAAGELGDAIGQRAVLLNDPQVPAGSVMAGQSSGLTHDIIPVKVLLERMVAEAEEIIQRLGQLDGRRGRPK